MDSQCPGCLGQAVVTSRLPSAIAESPWRHKRVPFVNIASVRSRSIKGRQWKHKMDYYGVVFAHLATGRGINAKDPSGLDSDRWIPHSRCCENPARAKALPGFSRHLSAGFTDLNPAPRGLSLHISIVQVKFLAYICNQSVRVYDPGLLSYIRLNSLYKHRQRPKTQTYCITVVKCLHITAINTCHPWVIHTQILCLYRLCM